MGKLFCKSGEVTGFASKEDGHVMVCIGDTKNIDNFETIFLPDLPEAIGAIKKAFDEGKKILAVLPGTKEDQVALAMFILRDDFSGKLLEKALASGDLTMETIAEFHPEFRLLQ